MKNVAVFYGGTSCERDISVITGVQCLKNFDRERYRVIPVLVQDGGFLVPKAAENIAVYTRAKIAGKRAVPVRGGLRVGRKKIALDCAVLCMHGGTGENGGLQGMLDFYGIPYTSSGVLASAIGMDKGVSKEFFLRLGASVAPYRTIGAATRAADTERAERELGYPIIVKPATQGSSIGIAVAKDRRELEEAVAVALSFDDRAVAERALEDFYEINCACLRKNGEIVVSSPEQPVGWTDFLSFEDKYLGGGKAGKMNGGGRIYPARLAAATEEEIRRTARAVYEALHMRGTARFDFLVDRGATEKVYLNEVNTVPGSLAYYLFAEQGLDYRAVLDAMIDEAIAEAQSKPRADFRSDVLRACEKGLNACKSGGKIV